MRLEQITYFLRVAEKKSITAAAKTLYISQPALSKQISLLEQELGVALFQRQTRGVSLTSAGLQFEKDLKNILKELERAKINAILAGKAKKQLLNVGCFDGLYMDDFLPHFFGYFKERAWELKLVLHRMSFSDGREALNNDKIDIWITLSPEWSSSEEFYQKTLVHRRGAIIFSGSSPWAKKENLKIEDFQDGIWLTVDRRVNPGMFHTGLEKLEQLNLHPREVEEVDNITTLITYLKLIPGFTLLSEDVVKVSKDLRKLVLPDYMGVDVSAVWKKEKRDLTQWMEQYDSCMTYSQEQYEEKGEDFFGN